MEEELKQIINHYGIMPQLKYIHSEYFELDESILNYEHEETLYIEEGYGSDYHLEKSKNHIAEELADIQVMLEQFRLYYDIPSMQITEIMQQKIERQLKRIEEENTNK